MKRNPLARAGGFKRVDCRSTFSAKANPLARAGGFKQMRCVATHSLPRTRSQERVDLSGQCDCPAVNRREPARKSGWI